MGDGEDGLEDVEGGTQDKPRSASADADGALHNHIPSGAGLVYKALNRIQLLDFTFLGALGGAAHLKTRRPFLELVETGCMIGPRRLATLGFAFTLWNFEI